MEYNDQIEHSQSDAADRITAASELAVLLEGLDEEVVTIAVMSHVDGLTQDEIAESIGLSRRTIVKRLQKFKEHAKRRGERRKQGADT